MRSPSRDETNYGWPFGYMRTEDREKGFTERSLFWPLFISAKGSKTEKRIFPVYSHAVTTNAESRFYLWPAYNWHETKGPSFERQRTRIGFFVYSDISQSNTVTHVRLHRVDSWPLFTYRHDIDGTRRWQFLALMEPLFPNNRAIRREYSQIWSVWRAEKNTKTGDASQSFLWNLYRRETAPKKKKVSLLFGLFQYRTENGSKSVRLFWMPLKRTQSPKGQ